jgi:hypothetical protein
MCQFAEHSKELGHPQAALEIAEALWNASIEKTQEAIPCFR